MIESVSDSSSETSLESLHGNGELILVVDDQESILRVTKMILESKHYKIITAHNGPEALAIFARETNSISVVLTDISLPLMDGMSLIRTLQERKPSLPFVVSTGESPHAHADMLAELGVTNLLTKPYDSQKLLKTLRLALSSGSQVN